MSLVLQNISIEVPQSDMGFFRDFVKKMGWNIVISSKTASAHEKGDYKSAMKRLSGCINLSADYDYKEELEKSLIEKYL